MQLYPTTFNQASRCEWVSRHPGVLPPEVSAIRITGWFDPDVFQQAVSDLVVHHESLRTNFPVLDGQRWQRVLPAMRLTVETYNLSHLQAAARDCAIREVFARYLADGFDIEKDVLIRPFLLCLSACDFIAGASIDHGIVDASSIAVMWEDLFDLYSSLASGRPPEKTPAAFQLKDFAAWQRQRISGTFLERLRQFWQQKFTNLPPPIHWDTERPRPERFTFRSRRLKWRAGSSVTSRMKRAANAQGTTVGTVLTAVLAAVVQRSSDQREFLIQGMIANRRQPQLERVVGFLANAVILRIRVPEGRGFVEVLRSVRTSAVEAYAHGELPTALIIPLIGPAKSPSYGIRPQVSHLHRTLRKLRLPSVPQLSLVPFAADSDQTEGSWTYDIVLITQDEGNDIEFALWYNEDVFDIPSIDRLMARFMDVCEQV